ncbi:uncharacterized protein MICPUCDRAFT_49901 [Micromonas pusilla CCMP1545]|uniref:Predicted protein n=1 Tax=Micromonas pusilla (strain CCMP1545) TaxID=564608 RepID=C1MGQ5_MICPC|nr:uncharacterized protein MICPUCDRAFT_49901 [Micromonas pusilla CCMP1545]EEH60070.1 predicted protein [Micromonas pusilla CCMP1545]|eukprot:XP_003054818.1 predicted protein [Micromonas pusilla CCMP1545]
MTRARGVAIALAAARGAVAARAISRDDGDDGGGGGGAPAAARCDATCQTLAHLASGLVLFWTVLGAVLFGIAMLHNLDTPTMFEPPKEERERRRWFR